MALLELNQRRPMNPETARVFTAVEDFIENHPREYHDSYSVANAINEDRKIVTKALKRLETHNVIQRVMDDEGNVLKMETGTRGRPPIRYQLVTEEPKVH